MIEANGLVKRYGKFTAVDNISMTLNSGETVALLGKTEAEKVPSSVCLPWF